MAAITPLFDFSNTQQSTASTSLTNTTETIAGASLANGVVYLVIATAGYGGSDASARPNVALNFGSTELANVNGESGSANTPESMRCHHLSTYYIITGTGSDALQMQFRTATSGDTAYVKGASIIAIPLTELTVDADYYYAQQNGSTAEATFVDAGEVTVLEDTFDIQTAGDHLVLASMESFDCTGNAADHHYMKLKIDSVLQNPLFIREWEDDAEAFSFAHAQVHSFSTGNTTLTLLGDNAYGDDVISFRRGRIIVIDLAAFDQYQTVSEASVDYITGVTFETIDAGTPLSITYTPNQEEYVLVLGGADARVGGDNNQAIIRLANTTDSTYFSDSVGHNQNEDTDISSLLAIGTEQISTAKAYALQGAACDSADVAAFRYNDLTIVGLTTASAGTEATDTLDGKAVVQSADTDALDGLAVIQSEDTDALDGKAYIYQVATDALDGLAVLQSESSDALDGLAVVQSEGVGELDGKAYIYQVAPADALDGLAAIQSESVGELDGRTYIHRVDTDALDGRAVLQSESADELDGNAVVISTAADTDALDGKAVLQSATTDALDGLAVLQSADVDALDGRAYIYLASSDALDGLAVLQSATTDALDGAAHIYQVATDTLDGLAVLQSENEDALDGRAYIYQVAPADTLDGLAVLQSESADALDGAAHIYLVAADALDGLAVLQSADTDVLDGKAIVESGAVDTDALDGLVVLQSAGVDTLDGLAVLQSEFLDTLDGLAVLQSAAADALDGRARLQSAGVDALDGLAVLQSVTTDALDGKAIVEFALGGLDTLDGKVKVYGISADALDGLAVLQGAATDTLDGLALIASAATDTLDGKVVVSTIKLTRLDGRLVIDTTTNPLDGKCVIVLGDVASGQVHVLGIVPTGVVGGTV